MTDGGLNGQSPALVATVGVEPEWLIFLRRWRPRVLLIGKILYLSLPVVGAVLLFKASPPDWVFTAILVAWLVAVGVAVLARFLGLLDPRVKRPTAAGLIIAVPVAVALLFGFYVLVPKAFRLLVQLLGGLGYVR